MATFYNQATLSYNGITTSSNITSGELVDVLSVSKRALAESYAADGKVTYIVSIVNSGTAPFTDITVSDDLGTYTFNTESLTPLTFNAGSLKYYVNGALQPSPTAQGGPPLSVTGISVPTGGNALLIYEATVNTFAPLGNESTILNTVTVSGNGITTPITATETVSAAAAPSLSIIKSLSPSTVTENGQITYTFVIQNTGNTAAAESDSVVVTDTFNPTLDPISVTFNGTPWTSPAQYTYDTATGVFTTVAGQITVPAAEFTQNQTTGAWVTEPGIGTLTVTGTI